MPHRRTQPRKHGLALVSVLVMLILIVTFVTISSLLAIGNRRSSADNVLASKAQYAAEAGLEHAMHTLYFGTKKAWQTSDDGKFGAFDACAFKKWLTGQWQTGDQRGPTQNNNEDCQYIGTANPKQGTFPNLFNDDQPRTYASLNDTLDQTSATGFTASVRRKDDENGAPELTIQATGFVKDSAGKEVAVRVLEQTVKMTSGGFADQFAVLTNDVNCALCHLQVDTMDRAYAATNAQETFARARMAVLREQEVNLNPDHDADSFIAGTLYVHNTIKPWAQGSGAARDGNGEVFGPKWASDEEQGRTKAGSALDRRSLALGLTNADKTLDATIVDASLPDPPRFAKVYQKYPLGKAGKNIDGEIPDSFPQVIPELAATKDRLISDAEWKAYLESAPRGTMTAGNAIVYGVRRPSSSDTYTVNAPISFDPTSQSANPGLYATTIQGSVSGPSFQIQLVQFLTDLQNNNTAGINNFIADWKGWLIQQAIASPNNRDLEPGIANFNPDPLNGNAIPRAISWPPAKGVARNNFWVRFDATTGKLSLEYRLLAGSRQTIQFDLTDTDLFPKNSNDAKTALENTGVWDGNLILDAGRLGDAGRAVGLNGSLYVNGDLVIRGQVKGTGRIVVRGNIYIVGDLVYACNNGTESACRIVNPNNPNSNDSSFPSYRNPGNLPKLALLAGGNILIGDFDFPDYRVTHKATREFRGGTVFDLVNDQVGRWTEKSNIGPTPAPWTYYSVPGATGTNAFGPKNVGGFYECGVSGLPACPPNYDYEAGQGDMGFVPMLAAKANDSNASTRLFATAPFGLLVARSASGPFGPYEQGGTAINSVGLASVIPLYPSNGPISIGNKVFGGFTSRTQLGSDPGSPQCTTPTDNVKTKRFGGGNVKFNYGFYCPPTDGKYLRSWGNAANTDPGQDSSAWMAQSPQNAALDAGTGMTTGWLGGLLAQNPSGLYTQIGDFSQTRLLKLMWLTTMERNRANPEAPGKSKGPLRTDGMFYSGHAIFALARAFQDSYSRETTQRASTEGRWIHNGSVIAGDLGFLVTGDYFGTSLVQSRDQRFTVNRADTVNFQPIPDGQRNAGPAMGVFFDPRLTGLLGLQGGEVGLQRIRGYRQVTR